MLTTKIDRMLAKQHSLRQLKMIRNTINVLSKRKLQYFDNMMLLELTRLTIVLEKDTNGESTPALSVLDRQNYIAIVDDIINKEVFSSEYIHQIKLNQIKERMN
jgi:hypothetical protein